jgi:hypothetical protein
MKKLLLQLYTGSATLGMVTLLIVGRKSLVNQEFMLVIFLILTIGISSLFTHICATPSRDFNNWE